mmetsp:Transcript_1789/g.4946  ORF Transcript_1789/g.4946 Transcript_1789/m.4946 type:complete len:207 (+) Transcript_1789:618-1238(+)
MARSVCRGRNRSGAARPGVLHLACHLLGGGFEDRNHRERGGAHAAAPAGACARGARADADASLRKGRKQRLALAAAAVTPNYASCCGGGESDNGGRNQRDLCGVAGGEAAALRRLVVARPRRRQARRVCDVVAHEVEERVLGPRGRVVPAAAPHALDHLGTARTKLVAHAASAAPRVRLSERLWLGPAAVRRAVTARAAVYLQPPA